MDKIEIMSDAYQAVLPGRTRRQSGGRVESRNRRTPTKVELQLLLRVAQALIGAVNIESALRAVAESLPGLHPDAVLLISNGVCGDSCYYLDVPQGGACLELNHQMCRKVRKLVDVNQHAWPLQAFTLDNGGHVVAPFSKEVNGGYIALGWQAPPGEEVQREALQILPRIAELAGTRLINLLDQLHKEEEQLAVQAATQSRHLAELRASEHEKAEAHELAALDELTGLQNRRGFLAKSEHCLLIARREGLACAVIFADVDGLKVVNDHFGHAVGDRLIRDAATIFSSAFRHADVVGRVGGDEFAAFTFDNATPGAIIQRIREKIAQFNAGAKESIALSLSIGVINCELDCIDSLSDYLVRADEQMYRQKQRRTSPVSEHDREEKK